jgi:benzodiazapine receptor
MTLYNILGFMTFIVACAAAAAPGVKFRPGEWYAHLDKPPWTPPDWVFAPVWTVLYFMIAIAGFLVWSEGQESGVSSLRDLDEVESVLPLAVFAVQLALNALWSFLFFGLQRPGYAFAEVVLLWLAILATIFLFFPVSAVAGWLLIPYLLWVSFAAGLNYSVWQRNIESKAGR